jgi:hypothetical protein
MFEYLKTLIYGEDKTSIEEKKFLELDGIVSKEFSEFETIIDKFVEKCFYKNLKSKFLIEEIEKNFTKIKTSLFDLQTYNEENKDKLCQTKFGDTITEYKEILEGFVQSLNDAKKTLVLEDSKKEGELEVISLIDKVTEEIENYINSQIKELEIKNIV